jgi:hypothetical protein
MKAKLIYGLMAAGSVILGTILFTSISAKAQSPTVYFGLHGGKTMSSTELTNTGATFSLDGLSGNGYVAGVHIGADLQFANSPIFAGVFVGADWGNNEFKVQTFTATLGNSYYAGGRLGVVATGGTKIYALAAWRQSEWSTSAKGLLLDDPRGWDLGIGIDVPIAKNITLGVEGVATLGAPFPAMIQGPTGIHAQIDQLSVMARLSFQLGGNSSIFDDAAPAKAAKACDPKMGCK